MQKTWLIIGYTRYHYLRRPKKIISDGNSVTKYQRRYQLNRKTTRIYEWLTQATHGTLSSSTYLLAYLLNYYSIFCSVPLEHFEKNTHSPPNKLR